MKHTIILIFVFFTLHSLYAQDSIPTTILNSADRLLASDGKLLIGGYGEVHYNQPFSSEINNIGTLDVHRMVILLGYNFNSRTQFISEIEFEHVNELDVEQAFLQYRINSYFNLRAGLVLIPVGIINEYHEPTTFNGVERPLIDNRISPTTWREIGIGLSGNIIEASFKYQFYLVNGFSSYDGTGQLNGRNGFRNGRQEGAESYINSPNFTCKLEYYGLPGFILGVSGYFGKTQSTLYNGIDKNDTEIRITADSSVTGITMLGLDARYMFGGLNLKGQFYYTGISNTIQYNTFTAQNVVQNDLGSAMMGYYLEGGYNVFRSFQTTKELIPFVRIESCNTHFATDGDLEKNEEYNITQITTGISLKLAKGAIVKSDLQFIKSKAANTYSKVFNAGIGVMF